MASRSTIRYMAKRFQKLRTAFDFAHLMGKEEYKIQLLSHKPRYKEYQIPKAGGGKRQIEDPEPALKAVMFKLNDYLQSCYYLLNSPCAYGFVISAAEDDDRNILTNAKRHLGCRHLLNVDLKDFFHQIDHNMIAQIWTRYFPDFEESLVELLVRLVSHRGRLPMGAPTSPVLSNYATLELDDELMVYCRQSGLCYTRYADDLSFSSAKQIKRVDYDHIVQSIHRCGFEINPRKVRWAKENQPKEITGLFLRGNQVCLEANYLKQVEQEIERYRCYLEVEARYRTGASQKKLRIFKQELKGKLNFAQMIEPDNERIPYLMDRVDGAGDILEDFERVHWLDLPYGF